MQSHVLMQGNYRFPAASTLVLNPADFGLNKIDRVGSMGEASGCFTFLAGGMTEDAGAFVAGEKGNHHINRLPKYLGISCNAFKLGISSEQDAKPAAWRHGFAKRTTRIVPLLILRFKCRTAYCLLLAPLSPAWERGWG